MEKRNENKTLVLINIFRNFLKMLNSQIIVYFQYNL